MCIPASLHPFIVEHTWTGPWCVLRRLDYCTHYQLASSIETPGTFGVGLWQFILSDGNILLPFHCLSNHSVKTYAFCKCISHVFYFFINTDLLHTTC